MLNCQACSKWAGHLNVGALQISEGDLSSSVADWSGSGCVRTDVQKGVKVLPALLHGSFGSWAPLITKNKGQDQMVIRIHLGGSAELWELSEAEELCFWVSGRFLGSRAALWVNVEGRDLDLCPDPLGSSAELVPHTLGCPWGVPKPVWALPGGAGMLQGWDLGIPARDRALNIKTCLILWAAQEFFPPTFDVEGKIYCSWVPTEHPVHRALCAGVSCEPQTPWEEVQHLSACPTLGL